MQVLSHFHCEKESSIINEILCSLRTISYKLNDGIHIEWCQLSLASPSCILLWYNIICCRNIFSGFHWFFWPKILTDTQLFTICNRICDRFLKIMPVIFFHRFHWFFWSKIVTDTQLVIVINQLCDRFLKILAKIFFSSVIIQPRGFFLTENIR